MFDSHCHLQDPAFEDDRPAVLERARAAGIEGIVVVASDPEDAAHARAVAEGSGDAPRMGWTAGLHPHEARRWDDATGAAIATALEAGAVAVGETGLDYHYMNSDPQEQARAFAAQLELAVRHDRPVVVHSRDAEKDTLALIAASGIAPERVVLHCFTGSRAMLEEAVVRGYYVSFSGIVTFARFPGAELAPLVPEERLLVESDAPYLAPVPYRGRRNEPAFVADTVRAVAGFRGAPPEILGARTRANALRFYRFPVGPGGVGNAPSLA